MNGNIFRSAVHVSAIFAFYLATMMLIPGLVDLYYNNPDWKVFGLSAMTIGAVSALLAVATRSGPPVVSTRFTFLVVNMLWFTFVVCATLPFYFSTIDMTLADSFFEASSGISATGATVLSGLDTMPPGILLWRSMLQWFGGLGVIVLGLFIFPFLKIGGNSFFRIESSDRYDRPFARFSTYGYSILGIYTALTALCAVLYAMFGMSGFDAINHAMTTLATGGYSTHDRSFAFFNDSLHWIGIIFMLIGAMPFTAMIVLAIKGRFDVFNDNQVAWFLGYSGILAALLAYQLHREGIMDGPNAIAHSLFNVVSIVTTTGYSNDDYMAWGNFTLAIMLVATLMGGCTGSTSGGIKAARWMILVGIVKRSLETFIYPNAIRPVRSGKVTVDERTQYVTMMFVCAFLLLTGVGTIMLAFTGVDLITGFSGTLTALANVGPGLGQIIGPAGNFGPLSDAAKFILGVMMLLGRLEIFAVLILMSPAFWRD